LHVLVRVDGSVYSMSKPFSVSATQLNGSFINTSFDAVNNASTMITPTRTIYTGEAGPMQVNLTFMNPVEVGFGWSGSFDATLAYFPLKPGNWVKQSTPFTYLSLTASSLDKSAHSMQVYSAITGSTKIAF
jgi:hypothetical protein